MITGDRVRHARELRGWTQTELAERAGVSQATVAYLEKGTLPPSQDLLERIALLMGFPIAFFRRPPVLDFSEGSMLYRSPTTGITEREKAQVRRYGASFYEIVAALERRIKPRQVRIPRQQGDPQHAARTARASMMLSPDRPIPHVLRAIERAGVWIVSIPRGLKENVESFSVWIAGEADVPVIGILQGVSGDRLRMTLALELGHLVLHAAAEGTPKALEEEAYLFAQEFLLPEVSIRDELVPPITLVALAPLKLRWGVSMQALIRRAKNLGVISPRQYTHLMKQINVRGWRKDEPLSDMIPIERPRGLRRMTELVYGEALDYQRIASDLSHLGYSAAFFKELLEAHATKAEDQQAQRIVEERGKLLPFRELLGKTKLREG